MTYTLKESFQADVVKEVLDSNDPLNLIFAFRFAATQEGTEYWYDQMDTDTLSDEARAKLEEMMHAFGDKE